MSCSLLGGFPSALKRKKIEQNTKYSSISLIVRLRIVLQNFLFICAHVGKCVWRDLEVDCSQKSLKPLS